MPGEGERREGDENPDKDPFANYAEELEGKQRESNGAPESDHGNSDQNVVPDRAPESPKMDVEVGQKEFEAYAKELKEKYDEEEGSADSSQVSQGPARANGDVTSQEGQPSVSSNEKAPNEQIQESTSPGPQQATDSATGDIRPKPSDGGHYQQNVNNESEKLNAQTTSPNPEQSTDSPPGKPSPEKMPAKPAGTVEPGSEAPPKIAPATDIKSAEVQSVEGQAIRDTLGQKTEQKSTTPQEPHPDVPKIQQQAGPGMQELDKKQGTPEHSGIALGSPNSRGIECDSRRGNEVYTRCSPYENKINGNIEEPKVVPMVLAGKWESRGAYFLVSKSKFEALTGSKLEVGQTYEIHYRIGDTGGTWTRFSQTENHAARPSIYLHVSQSFRDTLHLGASYDITIDHVTDKRCLRVTKTHQGPAFRIYRHYLGSMGFDNPYDRQEKNPIVEIGVKNLSNREQREVKCYTTLRFNTHKPSYHVCMILVKGLGARFGDIMEVQYVKRHMMNDFVLNFNSHQPKNLENVALKASRGKFIMKVDENEVHLTNPRLSTNKLEVCLRAEIEHTGKPIFFWFDGRTTRVRFNQKSPVLGMNAADSGVDISYRQSSYSRPTFRFRMDKFDASKFHEDFKLLSLPEYIGDSHVFRVSPRFQEIVRSRINAASGPFEAWCVKGDIAEEIQRYLLSTLGQWKEMEYHPFDHVWRTNESKKRGPDSVQRSNTSGKLSYFEFRWSKDAYQSYFSCRKQALDDLKKWPTYRGEPVNIAHVGTLEWDVRKSVLNFYLREAIPDRLGHKTWRIS
ncbi:MAG: hypothetical protein KGI38_09055 [Thaumarchaeota archaeon]|nr:hypothetical protein [Nitrososphaerota archaeon]